MTLKKQLVVLAVLAAALPIMQCSPEKPPAVAHYDLRLDLDPVRQHIRVSGTLILPGADRATEPLELFLHRQLTLTSFKVNGREGHRLDTGPSENRYMPEAAKIVADRGHQAAGSVLKVAFSYEGAITQWPKWGTNVMGPEWVEIGLYLPWFPFNRQVSPFTYRVEVAHDPGFTIISMGTQTVRRGRTVFEVSTPTNDIPIVAAPDLAIREATAGSGTFRIASTSLAEDTVNMMLADIISIHGLLTGWFGDAAGDVVLVASEREKGGGYGRVGGLFLAGLEDEAYRARHAGYLRYFAHELAHFWWHGADTTTWEDWLNEGLAEFSALMVIRELVGEEDFERRLRIKKEETEGTAPILGLDRNDPDSQAILYSKAPLLLAELEARMGADRFREFAAALFAERAATTDAFLEILDRMAGREERDLFIDQLRTR